MLREWVKGRMTISARKAVWNLLGELKLQRRHRAAVKQARRLQSNGELKLNLGCGPNIRQGWVNIDLGSRDALHLDLREPLPFPSNAASIIYSEHVFEHLAYPDESRGLLRESFRVLRPGGIFSVGVPDGEYVLRSYVSRDEEYFKKCREQGWYPPGGTTAMHQVNFHFRQGTEHKYSYDYETLAEELRGAGFVAVRRRPFDASLDAEYRRWGTLYVDGQKPG